MPSLVGVMCPDMTRVSSFRASLLLFLRALL